MKVSKTYSSQNPEVKTFAFVDADDSELPKLAINKPKIYNALDSKRVKVKKFDLINLELELDIAYKSMIKDENEITRTKLFECIRDLSYAILKIGKHPKHSSFDIDNTTWEYSLYLFERLLNKTFRPEGVGKMPWQNYIDKNLNHILYSRSESNSCIDLIEDMEFLIEIGKIGEIVDPSENYHKMIDRDKIARDLWKTLKIYYKEKEIKRLLPIASQLMYENPKYFINDKMPKDVADFTAVLISSAKRLASKDINEKASSMTKNSFHRALSSSVRSTVFLSSVVNAKFFPREFLLALDIDSLYRLVQIAGGKKLKIPTQRDLNTLIGSVVAVSKMIMERKDLKESIASSKKDFDLVFSHEVNVHNYIGKIIESMDVFGEDTKTDPMISMLVLSIKSLEKLMNQFIDKMDRANPETVLKSYEQLSNTLSHFTEALLTLSDKLRANKPDSVI